MAPLLRRLAREWPIISVFALLFAAAVAFQGWGLPERWFVDEITGVVRTMLDDGTIHSRFFHWPNLMVYSCYVPARVLAALSLIDPANDTHLGHVCRTVAAVYFLLTVAFLVATLRRLFPECRGVFAALLLGLHGGFFVSARSATVNGALYFCIALAIYLFTTTLILRRERDFYLSVAACGLATGAKYNGVFLFALLPFLWIGAFGLRSIPTRPFVRALLVSLLLAPASFFLTTPFALLDPALFVSEVEGSLLWQWPYYQRPMSLFDYLGHVWRYHQAFLSPVVALLTSAWLVAAAVYLGRGSLRAGFWRRFATEHGTVLRGAAVVLAVHGAYSVMNSWSGMVFARHFVPLSMTAVVLFLIAFTWTGRAAPSCVWMRRAGAATVGLALVFAGINAAAMLGQLPASAKTRATAVAADLVAGAPGRRLGVLRIPDRSPFRRDGFEDRIDEFVVLTPNPLRIDSFEKYLLHVSDFFKGRAPDFIAFEDVVTKWEVFVPPSGPRKRLDHGNPGRAAWTRMLENLGYREFLVVECRPSRPFLEAFVGTSHWDATDVLEDDVVFFRRLR